MHSNLHPNLHPYLHHITEEQDGSQVAAAMKYARETCGGPAGPRVTAGSVAAVTMGTWSIAKVTALQSRCSAGKPK